MNYYEIEFTLPSDVCEYDSSSREIACKTSSFSNRGKKVKFFNVKFEFNDERNVSGYNVYAAVEYKENLEKVINQYISHIDLPIKVEKVKEVDIHTFNLGVCEYEYRSHVANDDEEKRVEEFKKVVKGFSVYTSRIKKKDLRPDKNKEPVFEELLVKENLKHNDAIKNIEKTDYKRTLCEEFDRIYTSKAQTSFIGNPVQYILYCDSWEEVKDISSLLASALYQNKRLCGKRIAFYKSRNLEDFYRSDEEELMQKDYNFLKDLYKIQKGCALVLQPCLGTGNDKRIKESVSLDDYSKIISSNCFETLTILVFTSIQKREAEKLKKKLVGVNFIEIEKKPLDLNTLKKRLLALAKKDRISKTEGLLSLVEKKKVDFYNDDIERLYMQWQSTRITEKYYPQYKMVNKENKFENMDAYEKLQSLIGLEKVKKIMDQIIDYYKAQKIFKEKGLKLDNCSMHMVFTGNPGTAKTTVARLFAQILKESGILSEGNLIEVGRQDLVERYVGWTARCVKGAFDRAKGSVLFIDEAYSLCDERFGDEAINTIVQQMENQREDTIVIFAGYPDKMETFINQNPGMKSRIAFAVNFDNYNTDELVDILKLMAKENGFTIEQEAEDKARKLLSIASQDDNFGNGRYVRNLFEQIKRNLCSRIVHSSNENIDITVIRESDIPEVSELSFMRKKRPIGFAS